MSELTYLKAVILGVLQGLTEFLPVSSSAHLAISQRWLGLDPATPAMLLFDVITHLGTVAAVLIVFGRPIRKYSVRLVRESGRWNGKRHAWRIALLGIAALIPTAGIGLACKPTLEAAFGKPIWIGAALLLTGTLLAATAPIPRGRRGWKQLHWWQAVLIGVAQGIAILPGMSRSGSTICVATFLGLRRRWAAEFSFFIAVPAIVGATLMKLADTLALGPDALASSPWDPILLGSAVSCLVGIAALKLLLDAVRNARLHYFTVYCWVLGGLIIAGAL